MDKIQWLVVLLMTFLVSGENSQEAEIARLDTALFQLKNEFIRQEISFREHLSTLEEKFENLQQQVSRDETRAEHSHRAWEYSTVAFSSYPSQTDYLYEDGEQLLFDLTTVNIGGHYSTATGVFTVPVDGVYFFSLSTQAEANADASVAVIRNGEMIFRTRVHALEDVKTGGTATNMFECGAGDEVYLEGRDPGHLVTGASARQTSFTAFLLQLKF